MKRRFLSAAIALVVLFVSPVGVRADVTEAARHFDQGNEHYLVGNYAGALESYTKALNQGFASAALFYNMGNAYYRLDELGEAIRAYERARRLDHDDPEILHNLTIARNDRIDRFSRLPVPYWQRGWQAAVRVVGSWGFFALGYVFWLAAASLLVYRILSGSRNAWLRRGLAVSLVVGCVGLLAAYGASLNGTVNQDGVVVSREVELRIAPDATAQSELTVHEGAEVDILQQRGEWMLVRLPNGVRGWTESKDVGEIAL